MTEDAADSSTGPSAAGGGFGILLLLSGFCGISYEILYGRILSNIIGDQFAVSASILLTFLLGIGVGALYAHRFWRFLWLIEGGIGLYAVVIAAGAPLIERWIYGVHLGGGVASAMLVCFAVLGLPALLVGCSVPLFAGYLSQVASEGAFARAYTVYNFGAGATALVIEFWLLRLLGIRHAVMAIAAANVVVSAALLLRFRPLWNAPVSRPDPATFPGRHLTALALASVASAVFQLLMIKLAECVLGPFRETFALVLATVLFGIALGSAMSRRRPVAFGSLMMAALVSLAWLLGGFGWVARAYATLHPAAADHHLSIVLLKLGFIVVLMAPAAIAFGATIPAILAEQRDVAREAGTLLFVSSAANAAGFVLMAFVLHRYLDYGVLIVLVAALAATAALTYAGFRGLGALGAAALFAAIVLVHRFRWDENLLYLGYTSFDTVTDLETARADLQFPERFKGHQDVFSLTRTGRNVQFFINGFVSISLNSPAEKVVGAFSALFAPRTDHALVLGLGSGATGGTIGLLFDRTDAVEINPVVVQNLYRMAQWNFDVRSNPNVHVMVDDAIHHAKVATEQYSLIINTVTTPLYFSSSKLYTRDFLESVRRRLTPDGVYVTWVDSRVGDRGMNIILKTLGQSFSSVWIGAIKSTYFLLLCSQQPIALRRPSLIADNPVLADYFFKENGIRPEWLPYGLLSTHALALAGDREVPVNTLDYPALEFEIARLGRRGLDGFKGRLLDSLSLQDVAAGVRPMPFDPIQLAMHADVLLEESSITHRWKTLASREQGDFDARYTQAKLDDVARSARAAGTAVGYRHYGAALLEEGRYAESIVQFQKALELDPSIDNAYFNLGAAYEKSGALEAALESYGRELAVDPADDEVSYRQGRVSCKLERYADALRFLDAALVQQETAGVHYYRGLALEGLGRLADAAKAYQRALELDDGDHDARVALVRVRAAIDTPGR